MLITMRHLYLAVAFLGLSAKVDASGSAFETPRSARAIYFLTNERENSVVAIPISLNGTLSGGTTTPTGGSGDNTINRSTGNPNSPDALNSQSSLTVADKFLFAVNPSSNTVSMLKISDTDPTHLTPIGQPAALEGEFPTTVAASTRNNLVCVGTTGAKAGISCASYSHEGIGRMGPFVPFNLNQTTPPFGPHNTVSQTFFSEDEKSLITTVKGDPTTNTTGFVSVLPIENMHHYPSVHDTESFLSGTAVLFGSTVLPGTSNFFVTDASFGGAVLQINQYSNNVSLVAKQTITGQVATCWAAYSEERRSVYVTDGAVNRLVEMSPVDAKILSTINLTNGNPSMIDLGVAGPLVYALSPGNGTTPATVTVVDSFSVTQVQNFVVKALGATKNSQGLALLA